MRVREEEEEELDSEIDNSGWIMYKSSRQNVLSE